MHAMQRSYGIMGVWRMARLVACQWLKKVHEGCVLVEEGEFRMDREERLRDLEGPIESSRTKIAET